MPKLTIARLLLSFATVVTLGLATSIGLQSYSLSQLKVGGPVYNGIIDSKDLVADILPPPLYVVEAYMLASEAVLDPGKADLAAEKIERLKADYQTRRQYWQQSQLPDGLKTKLMSDVLVKGDAFWASYHNTFGSGIKLGDAEKKAAIAELGDKFWIHDAAVRELVDVANSHLVAEEAMARATSAKLERWAIIGSGISVFLFIGGILYFRLRAIAPLGTISGYMSHLAKGDLTKDVPFSDRSDEIGEMASSVEVFRQAALERKRLRLEAEEQTALIVEAQKRHSAAMAEQADALAHVVETLGAGLARLAECNIRYTIDQPFMPDFEPLRRDFKRSAGSIPGDAG